MGKNFLLGAFFALASAASVSAATIDLSDLQLNGSAALNGSDIRLTSSQFGQNGSAFTTTATTLAPGAGFSAAFQISVGNPIGGGADGIVFVLQNSAAGATAQGIAGGGIGYQGITNSLGIEFDTWNNGGIDGNSQNHVGINVNGSTNSVQRADVAFNLDSTSVFAWLDYDGTTLDVTVSNTDIRPGAPLLSFATDLSFLGGQAFLGFTASTGGASATHSVQSLSFAVDAPAPVPLPATGLMLLAGVGALALRRRKG